MSSRVPVALIWLIVLVGCAATIAVVAPVTAREGDRDGEGVASLGGSLVLEQPIKGDVQILGGDLLIETKIDGDVIAFGADVTLGLNAKVRGDVFALGGNVGGSLDTVAGNVFAPRSVPAALEGMRAGSRPIVSATAQPFSLVTIALKLSLLLIWFTAAVVIVVIDGKGVRVTSIEVRASPLHSILLGLVAFTSFVLTAIVFSYLVPYVIGILLLVALGVFAVVTKVYGMIAIFHSVGTWIARPDSREELDRRGWLKGDLAMVVLGLLVLGALRMIPVVGNVIWMIASLIGVGVALSTRFGRRDPAFLAWRPIVIGKE
ncbi:MAG: polymer-forming cytoskeletal protein [Thermoanaerobaculia bacterium]|nr:polymer-forming cytoskeletal protein [Thermoanaerobaculia bacterium]